MNFKNKTATKLQLFSFAAGMAFLSLLPLKAQQAPAPTPWGGAGTRPVAILLCQYSDKPNTYGFTPAGVLGNWMSDTIQVNGASVDNSINGLVKDASLGTINFQGSQAFGWFRLPNPQSSYAGPRGNDSVEKDCIAAAQNNGVNLTAFMYLAIYVNDALPWPQAEVFTANFGGLAPPGTWNGIALGSIGLTSPPLALHELGHLLSPDGGRHTDSWSCPLGGGATLGGDPANPPPYGLRMASVGPEWDASRRENMGFIPLSSIVTAGNGTNTFSLSRLTQPLPGLPTAIDVPLPNGGKYVISARTQTSYDGFLVYVNNSLVQIKHVNTEGVRIELYSTTGATNSATAAADSATGATTTLQVPNANGDPETTDAVWLTGQTFTDAANNVTIAINNFNANGNPTAQITVTLGAAAKPSVQINSGGGAVAPFVADSNFAGGTAATFNSAVDTSGVTNPAPQAVYQSERYGNFTYTIPNLTAGANYKVRLHFAEVFWTAAGQRVFNVSINGNQVLTNFDVLAAAGGPNKAIVKEFATTADPNGQIAIAYATVVDNAKSSGIEIIPQ